jgi:phage terminase small subunit
MSKLTNKQQRFIEEYMIDFNATRAYVTAGYSPKLAHTAASKLLQNSTISAEIEERKKILSKKATLTREEISEKLEQVINKFLLDGFSTSQALRAIEIYAKMNGLNEPDKIESNENITINYNNPKKDGD